jgi:hypothetical protein
MRALLLLVVMTPLLAQTDYPKHNITVGVGAGLPGGDLSGSFADSSGLTVGYGYRFQRHFQADFGLDTVFGAARVRDFLITDIGDLRINDRQYFLPFGGRVVLPIGGGRVQASLGGGGVYLRYSERLQQASSYYRVACPSCTSRSGWGEYALAGASMALDRYQRFRVGVTAKVYRAHTNGEPLGNLTATRTLDRWVNLFADFTIGF